MSADFTPGEWYVVPEGGYGSADPLIMGPNAPVASIHHITRVRGDGAEAHIEYGVLADAHLIAAAPGLYAALEETRKVWDALSRIIPDDVIASWPDAFLIDAVQQKVRVALAKARGEA